jgi:hypothetical protein
VRLEHLAHGELTGGGEIHEFAVLLQKKLTGVEAELFADEQPLDAQPALGILDGAPDVGDRESVIRSERAQDMSLDEIPEGEQRWTGGRRSNDGPKMAGPPGGGVRTTERPRSLRRGWKLEIARRFAEWVRRVAARVGLVRDGPP